LCNLIRPRNSYHSRAPRMCVAHYGVAPRGESAV
jgi:hypothetical protein